MTRNLILALLTLSSVSVTSVSASAATAHHYNMGLTVTPAMMSAIDTIVAEKARMNAMHRRRHR